MSEFSIDRPQDPGEPSRSVSSSEQTDADGGGGTTFVFHGGAGGGGDGSKSQQQGQRPHAPTFFGPPVELSLSGVAKVEIGYGRDPLDFGKIGPVLPPEALSEPLAKSLEDAKRFEEESSASSPSQGEPPDSSGGSDSSSGGIVKMLV